MRILPLLLVGAAGATLAVIALRAPDPSYEPPELDAVPAVVPIRIATTPGPGYAVQEYRVEGMCCAGCASKLHGALAALGEVEEAAVDSVTGRAQVLVPEGTPDELILAALRFDKYTAEPVSGKGPTEP